MVNYKELGLVNTREMFKRAINGGYAIPAFNFNNLEQLQAIIKASSELKSPVILQVSKGARNYANETLLRYMAEGAVEYAKELGCNKIALGHHYDDVIETILMGMLYGGQLQTMMPKLHSTNFEGMELIRPMYLIREDEIKRWRDYNDLHFIQCACKFTDTCTSCNPDNASKRQEIKNMIKQMSKINPQVESNIFKSVENVNLDTVIAFKKDGVKHNFLEKYKKKEKESGEGRGRRQVGDNKIVDMTFAVLTNEMTADKILNPGGFDAPKKMGYMVAAYKNPANEGISWNALQGMSIDRNGCCCFIIESHQDCKEICAENTKLCCCS